MHLISKKNQTVNVAGEEFYFKTGESIHTENSYKFSVDDFRSLARKVGFKLEKTWTDSEHLFNVHYLKL